MDRGVIEQIGTYESLYRHPKNLFVAGFLSVHAGVAPISLLDARSVPGAERLDDAWVGVRPDDVEIADAPHDDRVRGTITERVSFPLTNTTLSVVRVGDHEIHALTSSGPQRLRRGDAVWLTFKHYHLFDKESGLRLAALP
jgi:ABC-type sugar transport system ATPase subunit